MAKLVNDEGAFEAGFEQNLPEGVRDYAKQFKTLGDALEAGRKNQQEFRSRVKIPEDEVGKRQFLKENFQPLLEADAAAAKKKQDEDAAAAQTTAEAAATKAANEALAQRQAAVKAQLGGAEGKDFDKNLELARRAVRHATMPKMVKDAFAAAAGVDSFEKVTDDQIKQIISSDPMMAVIAQSHGLLVQDGRTERGDGHQKTETERMPAYPHHPEHYRAMPDDDPEKAYFLARGARYENGRYVGGYAATTK
jgi:hypothetical protein